MLRNHFLLRVSSGCLRWRGLTTLKSADDAWQLATRQKQLIGTRTMILSDNDSVSKESSNRMAYEMQRQGIQPVFCTMNVPYPSNKNIEESVELFSRTGARSIVAIGSGAVLDTAKAIRMMVETASRKAYSHNASAPPLLCREVIPLLNVCTTVSPVAMLSSFARLHDEEDVLIKSWCRPAEVVVYDPPLIESSTYFIPEVVSSCAVAQLFDTLLAVSLAKSSQRAEPVTTAELCSVLRAGLVRGEESVEIRQAYGDSRDTSLLSSALSAQGGGSEEDVQQCRALFSLEGGAPLSKLINIAEAVGTIQSNLQGTPSLQPSQWPGLVEISAQLAALNAESDLTLPYSWRTVESFALVLDRLCDPSAAEKRTSKYRRKQERAILAAIDASFACLTDLTGLDHAQLSETCRVGLGGVAARVKKFPKRFRRANLSKAAAAGSEYQKMTPAGHLEKVIAVDELEAADARKRSSSSAAGVAAPASVFDKEDEGGAGHSTLRSRLLKSDVMLDLVEASFGN